ncbi:hypothetical protein C8R45DRAFT_1103052 [Mycena sanguinolenta]|nr:hypothetical protein C8R45DRAFT_1103052 [Mycena sanguinolenta]
MLRFAYAHTLLCFVHALSPSPSTLHLAGDLLRTAALKHSHYCFHPSSLVPAIYFRCLARAWTIGWFITAWLGTRQPLSAAGRTNVLYDFQWFPVSKILAPGQQHHRCITSPSAG